MKAFFVFGSSVGSVFHRLEQWKGMTDAGENDGCPIKRIPKIDHLKRIKLVLCT